MANVTFNVELDKFLASSLEPIREQLRKELEKHALEIVDHEVSKWALSLSRYVSFSHTDRHLIITVQKELK